ncbi:hypothetical protein [Salegentibacter sp. F14]
MFRNQKIKAYFFLGIFILMSFHQVVPHSHHEHHKENNEIAHQHTSGTDHHHKNKSDQNRLDGFWSYLLAIHSHSITFNEIPVLMEHSQDLRMQKTQSKKNTLKNYYADKRALAEKDSDNFEVYHPPKKYFNPYLSLLSLRGPPQLV